MKAAVIINKKSGPEISNPSLIEKEFRKYDYEVILKNISGGEIIAAVEEALAEHPDILVISGGDGSISSAAQMIIEKGIPLGVLPAGTYNHFAKDAGIPLSLKKAVELITKNEFQSIDVGEVNGKIFINNSSVGLYPKAVKLREHILHKWGGVKWAAMFIAVITIFKRFPLFTLRIKTGNERNLFTTPFIFIGNNEYKFEIFNLGRRTTFTGGKLNLYTAKIVSRIGILKMVFLNLFGKLNQVKNFDLRLIENVTVETKSRTVNVAIDGEIYKLHPPLNYKILPKKLKVFLPQKKV